MAGEHYRHIFLAGPTRTQGFTSPRQGGAAPRIPVRDRDSHSRRLQQQLQQAWNEVDQRQAVVHVERQGAYIEFESSPGFDLEIKSLEHIKSGIQLLNVRKEGEGTEKRTFATVYIPHNRRSYFIRKIQAYATEVHKISNKPKNAKLVESISDIRHAVLKSFWRSDEQGMIPGDAVVWVEVWLSTDSDKTITRFETLSRTLQVELAEGTIKFPVKIGKTHSGKPGSVGATL